MTYNAKILALERKSKSLQECDYCRSPMHVSAPIGKLFNILLIVARRSNFFRGFFSATGRDLDYSWSSIRKK